MRRAVPAVKTGIKPDMRYSILIDFENRKDSLIYLFIKRPFVFMVLTFCDQSDSYCKGKEIQ